MSEPTKINPASGGTYVRDADGKPVPIEEWEKRKKADAPRGRFSRSKTDEESEVDNDGS